jgi:peptidoglycan/LPS O-acetylase OafA/YrhL
MSVASQLAGSHSSSLLSIQVLRAIAALLVLGTHASTAFVVKAAGFPIITFGASGVDLFFVISGFVMVYSSERLYGEPGAPIKFLARRLARIVPLYWAATTVLVWFVMPYASTKAVLGSLFFTPRIPFEVPLLVVGWTLIFEMFFYSVFAIALLAKRRFAVVACATLFLISFALLGPALTDAPAGDYPPMSRSVAYFADPIIIEFAFGMLIALVYRAGVRLSIPATSALILLGLVWCVTSSILSIPRQFSFGITAALIVAGMSLSSMSAPKSGIIIVGIAFLGDVSYALYLTHHLSFDFLAWVATALAINPFDYVWPYFCAMLVTALLIASATHLIFERPVTKFLQKEIEGRPLLPLKLMGSLIAHAFVPIEPRLRAQIRAFRAFRQPATTDRSAPS